MKKNMPEISIVMASFGNERYIDEAIRSVVEQSFSKWELIIVDDCSMDNSNQMVKKYLSDDRIKLIKHDINQGLGATRKSGFAVALGEIGACLDPDDRFKPDALKVLTAKYNAYPNAAMIIGALDLISEEGTFLDKKIQNNVEEGVAIKALEINGIGGWMTFRMKKYRQTDGYSGEYRSAEDQDLCFKMEEVGDVVFIKDALYDYRRHKNGLSQGENKVKTLHSHIRALEEAVKRRGSASEKEKRKIRTKKYSYFRHQFLLRKSKKDVVGAFTAFLQSLKYYGNTMKD